MPASAEQAAHWEAIWEKRAQERLQRQKRVVPLDPSIKEAARCRWCGGWIVHLEGRKKGLLNTRRSWHDGRGDEPDCFYEFRLHSRLEDQREHVIDRDGRRCAVCGADPHYWRRGDECAIGIWDWPKGVPLPRYQIVTWTSSLELDHLVPIWRVAHLPDPARRPFFGPENLWLLCPKHHAEKTRLEAAERAMLRRQNRFMV